MFHLYHPGKKGSRKDEGGRTVGVNVMLDLILVDYDPKIVGVDQIIGVIKKTGYTAIPTATL